MAHPKMTFSWTNSGIDRRQFLKASGAAAASVLKTGQIVLTAEFKINLLRAAQGEMLRCVAKVVKPGSRLTFAESQVWCERDGERRLVATASVTLAVVPAISPDES